MNDRSDLLLFGAFLCCKLGGVCNFKAVSHCATRVRVNLFNRSLADLSPIKDHDLVLDAFFQGSELQIVCKTDPSEIFAVIQTLQGNAEKIGAAQGALRPVRKAWSAAASLPRLFGSVIMPIVGFLAAGGILNALLVLLVSLGVLSTSDPVWRFFHLLVNSLMNFLPVLLGYTCARHFKTNPLTGIALGLFLIPEVEIALAQAMNGGLTMFDPFLNFLQEEVGSRFNYTTYAVSFLPIIMASAVNVYLERWCNRLCPKSLRYIVVPLMTLALCVPLVILVLAPLFTVISYLSSDLVLNLYEVSPVAVGALMGFFWQILVSFGMHWILTPAMYNNLSLLGYDVLLPLAMLPVFAMAGAAAGLYASSSKEDKPGLKNAVTMALLGITEPALYGFLLRRRRLFLLCCAVAAAGAAVLSLMQPKLYSSALGGVLALPLVVGDEEGLTSVLPWMVLLSFATAAACAALAYALNKKGLQGTTEEEKDTEEGLEGEIVTAPCPGTFVPLKDIPDPIFSKGMLGDGCAVQPSDGLLKAPCDGRLSEDITFAHAVGIYTGGGAQLLLHAGINTVRMEGRGFKLLASPGQEIKQGDPLLQMDLDAVKAEGLDPCVIMIAVETGGAAVEAFSDLSLGTQLEEGRPLFALKKTLRP